VIRLISSIFFLFRVARTISIFLFAPLVDEENPCLRSGNERSPYHKMPGFATGARKRDAFLLRRKRQRFADGSELLRTLRRASLQICRGATRAQALDPSVWKLCIDKPFFLRYILNIQRVLLPNQKPQLLPNPSIITRNTSSPCSFYNVPKQKGRNPSLL
jgi:hypothetical protein